MTATLALAAAVLAVMGAEALYSRRNERALRARGAREPEGDVHAVMQVAYPAAFVLMAGEGLARGAPDPVWLAAGIGVLVAAKALKLWVLSALGPLWSFRVLVLPGHPLVRTGPYRFLRHPNYVAVAGEIAGCAVAMGAFVTGAISLALFAFLIATRIRVEEAAIKAAQAPNRCGT
jgi:methyltransferase